MSMVEREEGGRRCSDAMERKDSGWRDAVGRAPAARRGDAGAGVVQRAAGSRRGGERLQSAAAVQVGCGC